MEFSQTIRDAGKKVAESLGVYPSDMDTVCQVLREAVALGVAHVGAFRNTTRYTHRVRIGDLEVEHGFDTYEDLMRYVETMNAPVSVEKSQADEPVVTDSNN